MLVFEILTFQKGVIGEIWLGADVVRANLMVPGSILHGGGSPRMVSDRIPGGRGAPVMVAKTILGCLGFPRTQPRQKGGPSLEGLRQYLEISGPFKQHFYAGF